MTIPAKPEVAGRLQRALEAFQRAQASLLTAHNQLKTLPAEQADWFQIAKGKQLERQFYAATIEVISAYKVASTAGLIVTSDDQHLIDTARRYINEAIE